MSPPILLLVFNRPDTTAAVLEEIRQARPERLYIAADGPRSEYPADEDNCAKVREIVEAVDWPCKVQHLFQAENLGLLKAVSTGIDWFFANEACGIILEDDTVPTPAFFTLSEKLLARYDKDKQVYAISGSNALPRKIGARGHFKSRYFSPWGWASWADRWQEMDMNLPDFERDHAVACRAGHIKEWESTRWRKRVASARKSGKVWSYQWQFHILSKGGRVIRPTANLVTNIGFGADATHTKTASRYVRRLKTTKAFASWMERSVKPGLLEDFRLYVYELSGGPVRFIKRSYFKKKRKAKAVG